MTHIPWTPEEVSSREDSPTNVGRAPAAQGESDPTSSVPPEAVEKLRQHCIDFHDLKPHRPSPMDREVLEVWHRRDHTVIKTHELDDLDYRRLTAPEYLTQIRCMSCGWPASVWSAHPCTSTRGHHGPDEAGVPVTSPPASVTCPACRTLCHLEQWFDEGGTWSLVEESGKNHRCRQGVRQP